MVRILYVDDEPEILEVGKTFFEQIPEFIVDTTLSSAEALSLLKKNTYNAIVSDYFMPDIDGLAFLKLVREINASIPFIVFTGRGDESVVIEALNNGADFYLKKEYSPGAQFLELSQVIKILVSRVDSEERLKISEKKFRTLAESSHDWIYWIDPDGRMIYVSPSCEEITGYSPEEFYSDPDLTDKIVYEKDRVIWSEHVKICTEENSFLTLDLRIVRKNGEIRWINHICRSLYDSEGNYAGRRVGNLDITKRKAIESLLVKERNNFIRIFSAAPVGLLLMDEKRSITQANASIAAMVLKDPADIIRSRGGEGLGCMHSHEDPRGCGYSKACIKCPLRHGIEEVLSRGIGIYREEIPLTLMINGHQNLRWLSLNAEPVEIEGKKYVIVAIDDVTVKHKLEIALKESEEKFRTLSDSTTAGILVYQNDHWTYANPAATYISGYSNKDLLSMHFWDIVHPDFKEKLRIQGISRQHEEDMKPCHLEIKIICKNGEECWVDLVASTIIVGQTIAGLVTAIDINERKLAEERLSINEEKYRLIFENQIDLYFQTDLKGNIINLSPSCMKLIGWSPKELIGTKSFKLYSDPEKREKLINLLHLYDVVYDFETELKNKLGIHVPVSISSHIVRDKDGTPKGVEGTIRDITERKKIEEALRKSEEHYRSLFDNMREGYAYCRMLYDENNNPTDWIFLETNNSFERITGLKNVEGKLVTDVIPDIREATPELFEIFNRVIISGISETFDIEFTSLNLWLHISLYRLETGYFVVVFDDITERKQAEITLHHILAQYETILKNVPVMIWYKDTNNNFVKINPAAARAFGKKIQDIEGKAFNEIFPELKNSYFADDLEVIQTKRPKLGVMEELVTAYGEYLCVQTDKVPLMDDKGDIFGILVVSTDVTERKKINDAIYLANKKLTLLSGITRHDIVNQLQGLFFSINHLMEEELSPKAKIYIEKVDVFARNIERQIQFTHDYEDIGVRSPTWQDVEVVIREAAGILDTDSVMIEINITGLQVFADPLLKKVFHNLIENSIKYGEKITKIRFSGLKRPEEYTIICIDDGIGIPQKYKSGIFRREYYKHTGFGLYLSREILDITGIKIIENGEEGAGAKFEITVPKGGYRFLKSIPGN